MSKLLKSSLTKVRGCKEMIAHVHKYICTSSQEDKFDLSIIYNILAVGLSFYFPKHCQCLIQLAMDHYYHITELN